MFEIFALMADGIVYGLLGLEPGSGPADALHFFIEDTVKIFVLLAAIVFVMGLFRTLLSPAKVRGYIEGKPRGVGYVLAVMLGAVTPFCSCSSVPLFIGFLEAGIPVGVTMAFLIASPMINEVAVVILASILGWQVALLYVGTGLAVGILGGFLIDRLRLERWVEGYVWNIRMGKLAQPAIDTSLRGRLSYAAGQVREIVGRVWLYVVIGIGIGSMLHGFVPQELFVRYASADNLLAVPAAVLAGIPLYSNATGIIPVAEALLAKSVPIGTVLALMMSVVAISVPEMIILRKVLTVRMLVFFAGYLGLAFIASGYMFNLLFT